MQLNPGQSAPYSTLDMLKCCEQWFAQHSPSVPCTDGVDRMHPMLESIRSTLATYGDPYNHNPTADEVAKAFPFRFNATATDDALAYADVLLRKFGK